MLETLDFLLFNTVVVFDSEKKLLYVFTKKLEGFNKYYKLYIEEVFLFKKVYFVKWLPFCNNGFTIRICFIYQKILRYISIKNVCFN